MNDAAEFLRWLRPQALWTLLPWALAVVWLLRRATAVRSIRTRQTTVEKSPWARVIDPALLPHLRAAAVSDDTRQPAKASGLGEAASLAWARYLPFLPAMMLGTLLLLALAGPQVYRPDATKKTPLRPASARVLLIDLSPAFDALPDADRQRLRSNLRRFVRELPAGETALIAVAGEAWLVVPPTEDVTTLDGFLAELAADAAPVKGDRPEKGLALARQTLAATGSRQADIFWLRVGNMATAEVLLSGKSGVTPKIFHADGTLEEWLALARSNAMATGWTSSMLNLAPPPDAGWIDLGPFLILLALPFAALATLRATGTLSVTMLLILAGGLVGDPARAADSAFDQGVAHYRAGRYGEAASAFAQAPASDPRAHYNRGNALARAGRLHEALAAYDESLRRRAGDTSTLHNREIVARLLTPPQDKPPPPPPSAAPPPPPPSAQKAEVARAVEQWLRRPPGGAEGLLKRKLALEENRRQARGEP